MSADTFASILTNHEFKPFLECLADYLTHEQLHVLNVAIGTIDYSSVVYTGCIGKITQERTKNNQEIPEDQEKKIEALALREEYQSPSLMSNRRLATLLGLRASANSHTEVNSLGMAPGTSFGLPLFSASDVLSNPASMIDDMHMTNEGKSSPLEAMQSAFDTTPSSMGMSRSCFVYVLIILLLCAEMEF